MGKVAKYTRRGALGLGLLAAGGLGAGYYFYRKPYPNPLRGTLPEGVAIFNPFVTIAPDNTITIYTPRAEMGQGVHSTLAAMAAEELDVPLAMVTVAHGPAAKAYYNGALIEEGGGDMAWEDGALANFRRDMMAVVGKFLALQITGGSSSARDGFVKMRQAGAAARHALLAAAAAHWGVDAASLQTADASITNPATGESLTYGALAASAATQDIPRAPALRSPADWTLLGKSQARVDIPSKVTGAPIYGIDVQLADMLYGTVRMSPVFGGTALRFDASAALALAGVEKVVPLNSHIGNGFGIVASNTWAAFQGANAIDVDWSAPDYPADSAALDAHFAAALDGEASFTKGGQGDALAALADANPATVLSAEYSMPFLAHATLEPMNATAQLKDGKLTLWMGNQAPGMMAEACADHLGLSAEDVTVHTLPMGGGFGRRAEIDAAVYAALLAAEVAPRPIKVTWSREEDTMHGAYRPMAVGRYRAVVTPGQLPEVLDVAVAAPDIMASMAARRKPGGTSPMDDRAIIDGTFDQPTRFKHARYAAHVATPGVPVGFWRSVGYSVGGFMHESFLDEIAHKSGLDPLEMRLGLMAGDERLAPGRAVLQKLAEISGWTTPLPAGMGRGLAFCLSFGTWVGQVVEVDATVGNIRMTKAYAVADPGTVLDPANFRAQIMGGMIFGLSQALGQEITLEGGQVQQQNFYDFDAMRMAQCPEITIELLENSTRMGGAGEPGTPPAAAALANAIFAATGQRIRKMPLSREIDFYS
ncbi:MAG: molybdopterin cofactor-binding domain-containing protein [Paracoccaceae bacterium]